jgi:hypothetical protein
LHEPGRSQQSVVRSCTMHSAYPIVTGPLVAQLESFRQQYWPHVRPVIAALDQAGDAERAAWLRQSVALLDPAVALPGALSTEDRAKCYAAVRTGRGAHGGLGVSSQICALWRF